MKFPKLQIPGSVIRLANRVFSLLKTLSPGTLAASGVTSFLVLMLLAVSLLGGEPEASESSTVIQIHGGVGSPGGHGEPSEHAQVHATPQPTAISLIASNGAVISDPDLIEMTSDGPLPKIARDGRTPLSTYGRKTDKSDPRPKIALIVGGLGMSASVTQTAVDGLPSGVTLAFSPYGSGLQGMVSAARGNGHEVMLEVPLEPYDYPNNDPGQNTLLAESPLTDNIARLNWVLSRVTGYAGLLNSEGSKFLASAKDMQLLLEQTHKRGIYFLDSGLSDQSQARDAARIHGAYFGRADRVVDNSPSKDAIDGELLTLEKLAAQRGAAIGVATAYPVSIERVTYWAQGLEMKGIALVPASSLMSAEKIEATRVPSAAPTRGKTEHGGTASAKNGPAKRKPAASPKDHDDQDKTGPHP